MDPKRHFPSGLQHNSIREICRYVRILKDMSASTENADKLTLPPAVDTISETTDTSILILPPWARRYGLGKQDESYDTELGELDQLIEDVVLLGKHMEKRGSHASVPNRRRINHSEFPQGSTRQFGDTIVRIYYPQTEEYIYGSGGVALRTNIRNPQAEMLGRPSHDENDRINFLRSHPYRLNINWVTDEEIIRQLQDRPLNDVERYNIETCYFLRIDGAAAKRLRTPLGELKGPLKKHDFRLIGLALEQLKAVTDI